MVSQASESFTFVLAAIKDFFGQPQVVPGFIIIEPLQGEDGEVVFNNAVGWIDLMVRR